MNYKITIIPNSGIISPTEHPTTFDGMLSYGYVMDIFSNKKSREKYINFCEQNKYNEKHIEWIKNLQILNYMPQTRTIEDYQIMNFDNMPINKSDDIFFASIMFFDMIAEEQLYIRTGFPNKHSQSIELGKTRQVRINQGQEKSILLKLRKYKPNKITAFFQSNNISEVERLMQYIHGVGKKRNKGGTIDSYAISEIKEDTFNFDFYNNIYRPVPIDRYTENVFEKFKNVNIIYMAYKPSYSLRTNQENCIIP